MICACPQEEFIALDGNESDVDYKVKEDAIKKNAVVIEARLGTADSSMAVAIVHGKGALNIVRGVRQHSCLALQFGPCMDLHDC